MDSVYQKPLSETASRVFAERLQKEVDKRLYIDGYGIYRRGKRQSFERIGVLPHRLETPSAERDEGDDHDDLAETLRHMLPPGLAPMIQIATVGRAKPGLSARFEVHATEQPVESKAELQHQLERALNILRIYIETLCEDLNRTCPRERIVIKADLLDHLQSQHSGNPLVAMLQGANPFDRMLAQGRDQQLRKAIVSPDEIGITFREIKGQDTAVQKILDIVDEVRDPGSYIGNGVRPLRGILLVGPPGTGKSMLAMALAQAAHQAFLAVKGSDIFNALMGESEQRARRVLEIAAEEAAKYPSKRAVLFVDEIDTVVESREGFGSNFSSRVLGELTSGLDGLRAVQGVTLLAATNRMPALDQALRDRFNIVVEVPLHDQAGRAAVLAGRFEVREQKLGRSLRQPDLDLERIAALTEGYSGRNLEDLVNETLSLVTKRAKKQQRSPRISVSTADMLAALRVFDSRDRNERVIRGFNPGRLELPRKSAHPESTR